MDCTDVMQRGDNLRVKFKLRASRLPSTPASSVSVMESKKFVVNGVVVFQVRVTSIFIYDYNQRLTKCKELVFVTFLKQHPKEDNSVYTISMTCSELSIAGKCFTCDDGTWHLVHEINQHQNLSFIVAIKVRTDIIHSFAPLLEHDDLTDFEMRAEGGAVRIHKAVLVTSSPVFKRMLDGSWKETATGHLDVTGTSISTLHNLKNYLYSGTLPTTGLRQLLVLAACYMIPDLEQNCTDELVQTLTVENAYELLKFAMQNGVTRLGLAVLDAVENGLLKVQDIRRLELYPENTDDDTDSATN